MVRDFDVSGDGQIQLDEFAAMVRLQDTNQKKTPHLELHFDVNKTVIMFDSCTGLTTSECCNVVLANAAWGRMQQDADQEPSWQCTTKHPSITAPAAELHTYSQYLELQSQRAKDKGKEQGLEARKRNKHLLITFTDEGGAGFAFREHKARLEAALQYPPEIASSTEAKSLGISENVLLLPSFLELLRKLKLDGQSFSVCFRTFGTDLIHIQKEFNSFCEGTHPVFAQKENQVKLDGSDGAPDMRIYLDAKKHGTFVRDKSGAVQLVLGTLDQPKLGDDIAEFYSTKGAEIHDATVARKMLHTQLGESCTIALRDYYPGWAAKRRTAAGGKVMFLDDDGSNSRLQVFFDDHILPADAHIVDVRWASQPTAPSVTMASLYNRHLVRAEPLHSIMDIDYFYKAVTTCKVAWAAALKRQCLVANALRDYQALAVAIESKRDQKVHTPYQQTSAVQMSSNVNTFDDEEEEEDPSVK